MSPDDWTLLDAGLQSRETTPQCDLSPKAAIAGSRHHYALPHDLTPYRVARFTSILAVILTCILSMYLVLTTILTVRRFYCPLPYGDMWWFVRDAFRFRSHQVGLSFLWDQHAEHRIVLPRLILLMDMRFWHFRGTFAIFCSFLFEAGEAMLLCFAYWRVEKHSSASRLAYAALTFGMMFSASQVENFIFPFQVQFPLAFFMASASILLVLHHCGTKGNSWISLGLGLVAAACATLSLGCGLLVWPVLLLICIIEHASIKTLCVTAVAGITMWISYFVGYLLPSESANPWVSLTHPAAISAFTFTFLTSALRPTPFRFSSICGLILLSAMGIGFILYIRVRSDSFWKCRAFFVYLAIFITATALLTALGRLNYGLDEAAAIRYRMPTLIFWACIIALASCLSKVLPKYLGHFWNPAILALLFVATVLEPVQRPTIEHFAQLGRQIDEDGIALAFDATDSVYAALFSLRPDLVRTYAPFLRANHLSIFSERLFTARGEPLTTLFVGSSDRKCSGSFEGLSPAEATAKEKGAVFGWGRVRQADRGPQTIVLADDRNTIVGLARGFEPEPDIAAYFRTSSMLATGWSGYYHYDRTSRIVTAYAILPDGKTLCPLGWVEVQH